MVNLTRIAGFLLISTCFMTTPGFASGGGADLPSASIEPDNIKSLQRGAANFMNYCSGCHSARYVRYNTIGKDLGLSDEQLIDNTETYLDVVVKARPASLKGTYVRSISLSSTMGPGVKVSLG